ncbi:uncharacterized protein [Montipora capricornis]|uniref:uncharacterized protein n=1 Tax=Montipora capricornis TaxID=246305 RepID=UPI0035F1F4FD
MTNIGKLSSSPVCVVDPAITECSGMGFGAFLLLTLDQIQICHSLGIHHPVVFWRGCNSACSRKRMINSWLWYFEPVNPGLEHQVEKVMCPFFTDGKGASILDSSFQNRSMVTGYDNSKIITKMTRMKVNKLIKHYARPNSEILERVRAIYNRQFSGYNMLGVHVRGTDHWYETPQHRLRILLLVVCNQSLTYNNVTIRVQLVVEEQKELIAVTGTRFHDFEHRLENRCGL